MTLYHRYVKGWRPLSEIIAEMREEENDHPDKRGRVVGIMDRSELMLALNRKSPRRLDRYRKWNRSTS